MYLASALWRLDFSSALNRLPEADRSWLPRTKAGKVNAWGMFYGARNAGQFRTAELRRALEAILRADKALVTTQLDARMVLHRLVAELTMSGRKRKKSA